MTWCVYAIARPGTSLAGVRGLQRERLTLIAQGRLAAVLGRVTRVVPPSDGRLRHYHAIQVELFRRLPIMLPVRYGTAVESVDALRLLLRSREAALLRALRLVRGRAQMTVRLATGTDARGEIVAGSARSSRPAGSRSTNRSGLAYLRERAAEAARARAVPVFDPIRPAVVRWIRAERVEQAAGVATIYHLVPRASACAYTRALRRAAGRRQVHATVSGPFPPFAFGEN